MTKDNHNDHHQETHIVSYREHFSTWLALVLLTLMTVTVSVYGADIYTLSVLTALVIATTKAIVVAYYFMHLKYDPKIYQWMIAIVMLLFTSFLILTMLDYMSRQ